MSDIIHVYPTDDLRPHVMGLDCPCAPSYIGEDDMIIHNAFDGREPIEARNDRETLVN